MAHAVPHSSSGVDGLGALSSACGCGALGGSREPAVVLVVTHAEARGSNTPRAEPSVAELCSPSSLAADGGEHAQEKASEANQCVESAVDENRSSFRDDAPSVSKLYSTNSRDVVQEYFSDTDVLRASSITAVLHRRCALLAGSGGSAETYAKSYNVKEIDTFVSHNWTVDRFHKFYALAFFFNLPLLVYSSVFIVMFAVALEVVGLNPKFSFKMPSLFSPAAVQDLPVTCRVLSLSSLLLLPFGHEIMQLCGLGGVSVFLDKTCIDQRTEAAKMTGIKRLGTFVVHSRHFFVIYSDVYFARLWTMYEIATFMLMKPEGQITLFPTSQGKSLFMLFVFFGLARVPYNINYAEVALDFLQENRLQALTMPIWLVLNLATYIIWLAFDRSWAYEQSRMAYRIRQFSVEQAECCFEPDREAVRKNLLSFIRHVDVAPQGISDVDAIAAFDAYVRTTLSEKLRRHGVMTMVAPYRCLLGVFHGVAFFGVDLLLGGQPGGGFQGVATISRAFCLWPLYFQLTHWFARQCLSLRHTAWKEWLYLVSLSSVMVISRNMVVAAITGFTQLCHQQYEMRGANRSLGLLMFATVNLLQAALVVWCFGPPRCRAWKSRATGAGDARRFEEPVGEFTI